MSVLSTGTGALIAFQRALATVSHNVANVNTEGYSRQRVEFATRTPTDYGYGSVGNGVKISDIQRVADELATSRLLDSGSELARLQKLSGLANRVDALFSDTATNVAGQALVPTIVAKREGILDVEAYHAPRGRDVLGEDALDLSARDGESGSAAGERELVNAGR